MLKIQRKANGDIVLTLSGRLEADNLSELSTLVAAERAGRALVLDLKDVVLVASCPEYVRSLMASEEESRS